MPLLLSRMNRKDRTAALIGAFRRVYPNAHCELVFSNPLQLLVATVLSAQCTDKRVNLVTETLFARYRAAADFARASQEELEDAIHSTGFFRNKAKALRALSSALIERHHGEVPADMAALTALPGVGRKTANVVLGNAFGINAGIVVDTHVARLAGRLGLTQETAPEKIEEDLMTLVPREEWTNFSHWLIWHGRRRCTARNPDCAGCEVQVLCPSAFKVGRSQPQKGAKGAK